MKYNAEGPSELPSPLSVYLHSRDNTNSQGCARLNHVPACTHSFLAVRDFLTPLSHSRHAAHCQTNLVRGLVAQLLRRLDENKQQAII